MQTSDSFLRMIPQELKKGAELVSRLQFSNKFLMKLFSFVKLHKLAKFITRVFTLQVVQ